MQHMIGIHCGRYIAFESGHNGAIGTVAEPSQANEPYSVVLTRVTRFSTCFCCNEEENAYAAAIGPTVCEEEGPTPMVNMSSTLNNSSPSPEQASPYSH